MMLNLNEPSESYLMRTERGEDLPKVGAHNFSPVLVKGIT